MSRKVKIPIVNISSPSGKRFLKSIETARTKRDEEITSRVNTILEEVKKFGNKSLFELTKRFDKYNLSARNIRLTKEEIESQASKADPLLKRTIREASKRIFAYHRKQLHKGFSLKTAEGTLSQKLIPVSRAGVYIPGGHTVYPSSVLMTVIPAIVAGVKEIAAITPPRNELDPGIAYALSFCKIDEVYRIGGAQGIAALAFGTESIPAVDKIVGPGSAYVATAKRLVYGTVDIDSIAGPSDVIIMADELCNPSWIALDMLAQAEHGTGDEVAICVTESSSMAEKIAGAILDEIEKSPVKEIFEALHPNAISILVTESRKESIAVVNSIGPEHLEIATSSYKKDVQEITSAAAIFLGQYAPVALGDYFIGTNHVLPTGGAARFASPLGVDSFLKRISVAEITKDGLRKAAPYVSTFARAEKFIHHALSVERRAE
jgi:histidinol dehydrogenase